MNASSKRSGGRIGFPEEKSEGAVTRRSFLAGSSLFGISAAFGLSGCSSRTSATDEPDASSTFLEADEVIEADIVIVGAGMAGLACAVEAAQSGARVALLEKGGAVGGNSSGVEGVFGVNSSLQRELGIHIEPMDIIAHEQKSAQYRADGSLWKDLIDDSAANIEWLIDQGVGLSGQVDNYYTGLVSTMHWFEGGNAGVGFVPYMSSRIEELGVDTHVSTRATSLVKNEEGRVVGCYAEDSEGGIIEFRARAVVLATGGIGNDIELLQKQGWGPRAERMYMAGAPQISGDGYRMALEAGAGDFLTQACQLVTNYIEAFGVDTEPPYDAPLTHLGGNGSVLWVNQDGRRFINENSSANNMFLQSVAIKDMKEAFMVFDSGFLNRFCDATPGAREAFDRDFPLNKGESVFKSDTLEGLAQAVSIDAERLVATVERYNELCMGGVDLDYGKDAESLMALSEPPYYIARLDSVNYCTIGAVTTNADWQVTDTDRNPIAGLYAIGNDGIMLYRNVYTVDVPCSCCGSCIESGRKAAQNALAAQ